jgi:hypothetical protein
MKRWIWIAALAVAACNADEETRTSALETSPAENTRDDFEREKQIKKANARRVPVGPMVEAVDWDEASGFKRLEPALLPASEQKKLAEIRLPILVPDDDELLASALVTHRQDWYAAAMETGDGVDVYIRGTRKAYEVPGMEIPEAAREAAENYTLTRTHAIVTVSWRSFGVSYNLDVECARPTKDERCTEDEFALDIVENLGVIGGTE